MYAALIAIDVRIVSAEHGSVKAVAALLAMLLTSTLGAPATCAGWDASSAERRECCQRAHHQHCHDQTSADSCCAGHEQGRHAVSAVSLWSAAATAHIVALPVPAFDSAALWQASSRRQDGLFAKRLHGPPVLLSPPLRI